MKKTAIVSAVVVAALFCGAYFGFERPARHRLQMLSADLAGEEIRTEQARQDLTQLQALIARHRADSVTAAAVKRTSPATMDHISALYRMLNRLGQGEGLRVEEITPSIEETVRYFAGGGDGSGSQMIPIQMTVRGRYRRLAELVSAVETNPYWDHFLSMQVAGSPELAPDCRLTLSFAADVNRTREAARDE
jgi:Tfp pilus assembly protein PilO